MTAGNVITGGGPTGTAGGGVNRTAARAFASLRVIALLANRFFPQAAPFLYGLFFQSSRSMTLREWKPARHKNIASIDRSLFPAD
jgi:hypothetical protein